MFPWPFWLKPFWLKPFWLKSIWLRGLLAGLGMDGLNSGQARMAVDGIRGGATEMATVNLEAMCFRTLEPG